MIIEFSMRSTGGHNFHGKVERKIHHVNLWENQYPVKDFKS